MFLSFFRSYDRTGVWYRTECFALDAILFYFFPISLSQYQNRTISADHCSCSCICVWNAPNTRLTLTNLSAAKRRISSERNVYVHALGAYAIHNVVAGWCVCVCANAFFTREADVRELQLHQSHSISGWVVCFYFRSVHLQNWHALEWFRFGCSENESMKFAWSTNFVDSNFISNHFYLMIIMCVCTRNT